MARFRCLGILPGSALFGSATQIQCDTGKKNSPSIFEAALADPKAWGDKKIATKHYLKDIDSLQKFNRQVIAHRPFIAQNDRSARTLRIVSWNVNNLCGLAGNSNPWGHPYPPAEFYAIIRSLQPDVVVLQEVVSDSSDYDDKGFAEACSRVQQLEDLIKTDGLSIYKSSCGNPTLLATALPITRTESLNLDDDHQWSHTVSTTPGRLKRDAHGVKIKVNESRAALYVQLDLGTDRQFGIYATHLHHRNYTTTPDGARAAEMRTLLKHHGSHEDVAALIVGDLNQPRTRDYSSEEWHIISGSSVDSGGCAQRNITEDDGVDGLLQNKGFHACWDLPAVRNFGGAGAPPMTHWSGITVDYIYLQSHMPNMSLVGTYALFTPLSDHLPIVVDVNLESA